MMNVTYQQFIDMNTDAEDLLPVDDLYSLQSEITEYENNIDSAKKKLRTAILRRYIDAGQHELRSAGKDTGSTTLHASDDIDVRFEIPKKVEWNQAEMLKIVEDLSQRGVNVREIVKIVLTIEERKFNSLPDHVKAIFIPARTVKDGDPKALLVEAKKKGL